MTLYQGRPSAAEGSIFRRHWFQTYSIPPERFDRVIQSWDTAAKVGSSNDWSVCTTWGTTSSGYYLLSLWRGKVEFPDLKRQFAALADERRPDAVLVEATSAGVSLIQELKSATRHAVIPVKADQSKELRAQSCTPMFESGRVFFPESAPWLADFIDELVSFPGGGHDDMLDSTTQALNYLRGESQVYGLLDFYKSGAAARELAQLESGARITRLPPASPAPAEKPAACPRCGSVCTIPCNGPRSYWCNQCGTPFGETAPITKSPSRADYFARAGRFR